MNKKQNLLKKIEYFSEFKIMFVKSDNDEDHKMRPSLANSM